MLIAFIAVVSVQWIWMKYSMREGEARFTSKVYDVLGKAVNLVEQTNNIRLFNDLKGTLHTSGGSYFYDESRSGFCIDG